MSSSSAPSSLADSAASGSSSASARASTPSSSATSSTADTSALGSSSPSAPASMLSSSAPSSMAASSGSEPSALSSGSTSLASSTWFGLPFFSSLIFSKITLLSCFIGSLASSATALATKRTKLINMAFLNAMAPQTNMKANDVPSESKQ